MRFKRKRKIANAKIYEDKRDLYCTWSKLDWKRLSKRTILNHCALELSVCAATKSTLNLMNCEFVSTKPFKEPHPIWRHVHPNTRDVRRATIKARLLSGTYLLQTNVSTFSKRQVSPNCPLCAQEPEDRTHFLLRCPKLEQRRRPLMEEIFVTFQGSRQMSDTELTRRILDSSHTNFTIIDIEKFEYITRKLVYALHSLRAFSLNYLP